MPVRWQGWVVLAIFAVVLGASFIFDYPLSVDVKIGAVAALILIWFLTSEWN